MSDNLESESTTIEPESSEYTVSWRVELHSENSFKIAYKVGTENLLLRVDIPGAIGKMDPNIVRSVIDTEVKAAVHKHRFTGMCGNIKLKGVG